MKRKLSSMGLAMSVGQVIARRELVAFPDLGPASCIQLLDEPGKAEEMDLMR